MAQAQHQRNVVLNHENPYPRALSDAPNGAEYLARLYCIETGGRLVQEQQRRIGTDRAPYRYQPRNPLGSSERLCASHGSSWNSATTASTACVRRGTPGRTRSER